MTYSKRSPSIVESTSKLPEREATVSRTRECSNSSPPWCSMGAVDDLQAMRRARRGGRRLGRRFRAGAGEERRRGRDAGQRAGGAGSVRTCESQHVSMLAARSAARRCRPLGARVFRPACRRRRPKNVPAARPAPHRAATLRPHSVQPREANRMTEYELIKYDVDDPIATITLNRPEQLNAITGSMLAEMKHAMAAAERDERVVGIVLTGAGARLLRRRRHAGPPGHQPRRSAAAAAETLSRMPRRAPSTRWAPTTSASPTTT